MSRHIISFIADVFYTVGTVILFFFIIIKTIPAKWQSLKVVCTFRQDDEMFNQEYEMNI